MTNGDLGAGVEKLAASPPSQIPDPTASRGLDDRDKKLALKIEAKVEQRMLSIIRQERGDPYGGLPADDVLERLHRAFPEVNFPERMMRRLELEQAGRHEAERRQDEALRYEAETRRRIQESDYELRRQTGRRAGWVFLTLLVVGLLLVFTGHESIGATVLGTTMVGVLGAFLWQRLSNQGEEE